MVLLELEFSLSNDDANLTFVKVDLVVSLNKKLKHIARMLDY